MMAGPCCEVRRSRSRNPLGVCSAAFRSKARKSAPRWLSETRFRVADTMESREGGMNINYTEVALGYGVSHPCESKFYSPGIVAQYSADPRTGMISKSTKSSQRRIHSFKE